MAGTSAYGNDPMEGNEKVRFGPVTDSTVSSPSIESAEGQRFDRERTKKLLRKMDWNIVPFLALLYLYAVGAPNGGYPC
jgi:hypothetical protein